MTWDDRVVPKLHWSIDRTAHGFSKLGYQVVPRLMPQWRGVEVQRDVPYRRSGLPEHRLDVYRPSGKAQSLPTIFYVHGGAFSMMSKDTHAVMAYQLASHGYQVFMVNYRQGVDHAYPRPIEDVCAALLWVLERGAELGADLDRLALMGESAGANLTAALAYCVHNPRPELFARAVYDRNVRVRCVLPMYGAHDMHDMERFWRDPRKRHRMASWIKRTIVEMSVAYLGSADPRRCPLASPLRLYRARPPKGARRMPPFFMSAGTADPLLADTIGLREALEARGVDCELHVHRGEMHAFDVLLWRSAARAHWRAVFAFLERHLKPTIEALPADAASHRVDDEGSEATSASTRRRARVQNVRPLPGHTSTVAPAPKPPGTPPSVRPAPPPASPPDEPTASRVTG
ncbi:MAG: alpha/beta hydrolase [Myxococcales bacterium]|nr:alpha/beta hydrolase [Myxococcales bacterium]